MSEKDFLSQFSGRSKPESFKEEERIPVKKEKKPFKPIYVIIPLIVLILVLGLCYFLFWAPKIVMKDFVGLNKTEISSFVRQQGIEPEGIVFREEYSFDYEKDTVVFQSVEAGKKIRKNEKIDFIISLGADPDEAIRLPDIANMTKDELDAWSKENKLQKTKITTAYSETVPSGEVITFDLKGDADEFTRGTTLNITVSKGPAPAGTVQVQDFIKKQYYEAETWAKQNKVEIVKNEAFSTTVEAGQIISQYPSSGTMKTGEVFSVTVSKGKGITVPDFSNMKESDLRNWERKTGVILLQEERYSESTKHVISQSPAPGTVVGTDMPVTVVINKGNGFYMKDEGLDQIKTFNKFIDKMYELRELGLDVYAGQWNSPDGVYSYEHPKGEIVSITCSDYSSGEAIACDYKLPLDARFDLTVSKGIMFDEDVSGLKAGDGKYFTAELSDLLASKIYLTYFVKTDEDTCDLYVNGYKVTGDTVHLVEGDSIELR